MWIKILTFTALAGLAMSGCGHVEKPEKVATIIHNKVSLKKASQQNYTPHTQNLTQTVFLETIDIKTTEVEMVEAEILDAEIYTPTPDVQIFEPNTQVEIYESATQFSGYEIELYEFTPSVRQLANFDPREAEFGKLNGASDTTDWQDCETNNLGYLFFADNDLKLNPGFEVCMRNKGYVLSTEYGLLIKPTLNAKTAGLRGNYRFSELSVTDSNLSP